MEKEYLDLIFSAPFQALRQQVDEPNLFEVLGIQRDEVRHSRILAYFLQPDNGVVDHQQFLTDLAARIYRRNEDNVGAQEILPMLKGQFTILREKYHIDILLVDYSQKVVVGIENKIDHFEPNDQVTDYQKVLSKYYADFKRLFLFLTPDGRQSVSCSDKGKDKCFSVAWEDIYYALLSAGDRQQSSFLDTILLNLEKELVMDKEEKQLIKEIYANYDYARLISKLHENRPQLNDIKFQLRDAIKEYMGQMPIMTQYPSDRDQPYEIKFEIKDWSEAGYKIHFIFHLRSGVPLLQALVWNGHLDELKSTGFHEIEDSRLDNNLPKIAGWPWHKVFHEDDYPEENKVYDLSFSEYTVEALMEKFKPLYEHLKEIIQPRLAGSTVTT